ncbi:MAG: CinA family protein [Rhodospirillales bacterium]|nr:CinA family protein [Rhodospirillales bacterium]
MAEDDLASLSERVLTACRSARLRLAVAESCTGGLVLASLTAIPGASDVVERGFVTYSNEAKSEMLGVPGALIKAHGAVSEPVARAMAEGALCHSPADVGIGVTGIAGPGGATVEKPIGLVHIAAARKGRETRHERHLFAGDRAAIRLAAAAAALALIGRQLS